MRIPRSIPNFALLLLFLVLFAEVLCAEAAVTFEGGKGPGKGKHIVLVSGDEEYRSEEMLPELARILSQQHGFRCTVIFAIDRNDGTVNPNQNDNLPGIAALDTADLMILMTRWRDLPDEQSRYFEKYVRSGRPIVAIRTATHPFNFKTSQTYARWSSGSKEWDGGFGRQLLGETWISHHGAHGKQSTRAVIAAGKERHPVLRGVQSIWGPTDVYTVRQPFPPENDVLLLGQVLSGMEPLDTPVTGGKNEPMLPVAWTRSYRYEEGKTGKVFTTTMGSSVDFLDAGFRRLIVNASYWALGREKKIPASGSRVDFTREYKPTPFGFNGFQKGKKPEDF